jgi:hypothetical protein
MLLLCPILKITMFLLSISKDFLKIKRGKLKDCFGARDMDDEEEKKMLANLRKFWKQSELRGAKL